MNLDKNLESQWEADEESNGVEESPRRLWQRHLVCDGMKNSWYGEDTEVPESHRGAWFDEYVEKTEEQERWNVLQVVQVIPEIRNQPELPIRSFRFQLLSHNKRLLTE